MVSREALERPDLPEEVVRDQVAQAGFFASSVPIPYDSDRPLARVVDRYDYDGRLARRPVDAGVGLIHGHAVRSVAVDDEYGITITARTGSSAAVYRDRALVVASRPRGWVREESGVGAPEAYVNGVHLAAVGAAEGR